MCWLKLNSEKFILKVSGFKNGKSILLKFVNSITEQNV